MQQSRAAEARRSESRRSMMGWSLWFIASRAPDLSQACGDEPPAPVSIECSGKIVEAKSDVSTSASVFVSCPNSRALVHRVHRTTTTMDIMRRRDSLRRSCDYFRRAQARHGMQEEALALLRQYSRLQRYSVLRPSPTSLRGVGYGKEPGEAPPAGYALFDPGKTGTPPGTSTSTILTLEVTIAWFDPSWTTLVPGTRSVMGMVTAKVRHVNPRVSGYGQGVGCA
jgi:hypothetical protein